jgi:putative membrane protein
MAQELNPNEVKSSKKQLFMKQLSIYLLSGALALACFSCGNNQPSSTDAAKDSNATKMSDSNSTNAMASTVSKADQNFAVDAANGGMTEVKAGQMAEEKGMAKDVKEYGKMMVKDHTELADKLKGIATSKNITLPATVSPEMQKDLDDLDKKSGKDFDKAFLDMMVSDHKKVISAFQDEAKNGSDADIRAFADSSLHILQHHLDDAQKCQKMEKKM